METKKNCRFQISLVLNEIYYYQRLINTVNICQRFQVDGEDKYLPEVQELIRPERNTLTVSYQDVESYNAQLSTIIQEEYYR